MPKKAKAPKTPKSGKPYRLSHRIVGLTILVDGVFLVFLMALIAALYYVGMKNAEAENAALRAEAATAAVDAWIGGAETDVVGLSADPTVKEFLARLYDGADPSVPLPGDPDYAMVLRFYEALNTAGSLGGSDPYDFLFVASTASCLTGDDGCYVGTGDAISDADWNLTERPWYLAVQASADGVAVSDPYVDARTGEYVVTIAATVKAAGLTIGYVGIDVLLSSLPGLLAADPANPVLIYAGSAGDETVLYYSGTAATSYGMLSGAAIAAADADNGYGDAGVAAIIAARDGDGAVRALGSEYVLSFTALDRVGWTVVALVDQGTGFGLEITLAVLIALVLGILAVVGAILSKRIGRSLSPIDDILDSIEEIKRGKYDVKVNVTENNELKHVADAINIMSSEIGDQMDLVYKSFLYDAMTGLKNRRASHQEIEEQYLRGGEKTAFCMIDLNNLKNINVTKGLPVGDELLRAFADRLVDALGSKERVYSNGGNEFLFVLPRIRALESVEATILKVFDRFRAPIDIRNIKVEIKCNIGVAVYPYDGRKLEELVKKCDTALFKAKEQGNARFVFYNDQITREVNYKAQINEQLADAVEKNQLSLKFQPLVDIHNEIYGFEALARWKSPTLGEISPQIFISNAEESHLIIPIGTWILREACKAQVAFAKRFGKDFVMSVNVSPVQILQKDFIEVLRKVVVESDIDPRYLVLEITEGILIDSTIYLEETIDFIHEIGARIALDDFGTGYASLTYVRKLPFDNLKIDKSFVDGIFTSKKDHAILGSIVDLVHNLNMKVIAEGVETRKQYEFLKQITTDVYQGFLFSKPLTFDESATFVDQFYKVAKAKRIDVFGARDYTKEGTES
ncbi:MAG: EAL domain-containing protein [Candidatus Izemoplasmatales bacterium]